MARCSAPCFALYASHGLEAELGGWIIIHGSTELFAIVLAGAAGFRIGWSRGLPGRAAAGSPPPPSPGGPPRLVMAGVVAMLFVAGLLEGFGRQLITDDAARYTIGGTMLRDLVPLFLSGRGAQAHG